MVNRLFIIMWHGQKRVFHCVSIKIPKMLFYLSYYKKALEYYCKATLGYLLFLEWIIMLTQCLFIISSRNTIIFCWKTGQINIFSYTTMHL